VKIEFQEFAKMLGRRLEEVDRAAVFGSTLGDLAKVGESAYVESQSLGLAMAFRRAEPGPGERRFVLRAVHFYREGHEGFRGYAGPVPYGTQLGDTKEEVREAWGPPLHAGGGGIGALSGRPVSPWLQYEFSGALLNFEFDDDGRLRLITLHAER
jgi:hypothetical protein